MAGDLPRRRWRFYRTAGGATPVRDFLTSPTVPTDDRDEILAAMKDVQINGLPVARMLLCVPREHRAAYLLADVAGLTDVEGAEVLGCSREAFRQRISRARRTLKHVIDNRCGLIDPANPCRCGRQITASIDAGILRPGTCPWQGIPVTRFGSGSSRLPSNSTR